jgi:hypothetical protein
MADEASKEDGEGEEAPSPMPTRDDVHELLWREWKFLEWQVQGFGMLRTYLGGPGETRLQIWDQRLAAVGNSAIHDHPWDFTSKIIAGTMINQRYRRPGLDGFFYGGSTTSLARHYKERIITPGVAGGASEEIRDVFLMEGPIEVYSAGEQYSQTWDELHLSRYVQGTVTVIQRHRTRGEDKASSIWPADNDVPWSFYESRPAGITEVRTVIDSCLRMWWLNDGLGGL